MDLQFRGYRLEEGRGGGLRLYMSEYYPASCDSIEMIPRHFYVEGLCHTQEQRSLAVIQMPPRVKIAKVATKGDSCLAVTSKEKALMDYKSFFPFIC